MIEIKCGCIPNTDRYTCAYVRYPNCIELDDRDEGCGCPCHDEDDDDD